MKFTLEINMDGAAFENDGDGGWSELLACLDRVRQKIDDGAADRSTVLDTNGNRCGAWRIEL